MKSNSIDKKEIERLLPHREPMLLIEKLINITLTFNSNSIKQKLQQMMPEYEPLDYSPPVPNEAMNQELFEIEKSTIKGQA